MNSVPVSKKVVTIERRTGFNSGINGQYYFQGERYNNRPVWKKVKGGVRYMLWDSGKGRWVVNDTISSGAWFAYKPSGGTWPGDNGSSERGGCWYVYDKATDKTEFDGKVDVYHTERLHEGDPIRLAQGVSTLSGVPEGAKGIIKKIDGDGDALVDFKGIGSKWIAKADLANYGKVRRQNVAIKTGNAGSSAFNNAHFEYYDMYKQKPRFRKKGYEVYIEWDGAQWDMCFKNTSDDWKFSYKNKSDTAFPPLTGWELSSAGSSPAPSAAVQYLGDAGHQGQFCVPATVQSPAKRVEQFVSTYGVCTCQKDDFKITLMGGRSTCPCDFEWIPTRSMTHPCVKCSTGKGGTGYDCNGAPAHSACLGCIKETAATLRFGCSCSKGVTT